MSLLRSFAFLATAAFLLTAPSSAQVTNVTQGNSYSTIQDAVDDADDGDEIVVDPGVYVGTTHFNHGWSGWLRSSGGPDVTTLRVTNSVLPVFEMSGGQGPDLVIEGFEFHRTVPLGGMVGGGALKISQSSPRFVDCEFSLLVASRGGAVRAYNGSTPSFERCVFIGCVSTSEDGGAVELENGGSFIDCEFLGCDAERRGGAVYTDGGADFTGCTFDENTAEVDGGAIYTRLGDVTLDQCTFTENKTIDGTTPAADGGAVHAAGGTLTIDECNFSENTAQGEDGGAIMIRDGALRLRDSTFTQNGVPYQMDDTFSGGAVFAEDSEVKITDCTFDRNECSWNGGAISILDWPAGTPPSISGCAFLFNDGRDGGGLFVRSTDPLADGILIQSCDFTGNVAPGSEGGAIHLDGTDARVHLCTFESNIGAFGGAIYVSSFGAYETVVSECLFHDNRLGDSGGAINMHASGDDAVLTVASCQFLGNGAFSVGGALRGWGFGGVPRMVVIGCAFSGNFALNTGGAISCTDLALEVHESSLYRNSAAFSSGIKSNFGDVTLRNVILWQNDINVQGATLTATGTLADPLLPGTGNIIGPPAFATPLGPDGLVGTLDDNLRLQQTSPCIDAGIGLPAPDAADLDGDGDTNEPTPLDLDGHLRRFDHPGTPDTGSGPPPIVDMGCYEFGSYAPGSSIQDDGPIVDGGGPTPGQGGGTGSDPGGNGGTRGSLPEPFPVSSSGASSVPVDDECARDLGGGRAGGPALAICRDAVRDGWVLATVWDARPGAPVLLAAGADAPTVSADGMRLEHARLLGVAVADARGEARLSCSWKPREETAVYLRAFARDDEGWVPGNVVALVSEPSSR